MRDARYRSRAVGVVGRGGRGDGEGMGMEKGARIGLGRGARAGRRARRRGRGWVGCLEWGERVCEEDGETDDVCRVR